MELSAGQVPWDVLDLSLPMASPDYSVPGYFSNNVTGGSVACTPW